MTEISYQGLTAYLKEIDPAAGGRLPQVQLIHGEDLFVRRAFDEILHCLLPDVRESLNYEPVDGVAAGVGDVVALMNTYSLLGGTKVVAYRDARLFHAKEDGGRLFESARKARAEGDLPRAAKHLLAALAQMQLSLDDMRAADRAARMPPGVEPSGDDTWIDGILEHCAAARLDVPPAGDAGAVLEKAIEKGFPHGHHLIITTDLVDRRRSLFKLIGAHGVVVDCSVPKGERRADREAQEAALAEHMKAVLAPSRKTMNRAAFLALCEMTGFDPGTFANNLQILADHAGERREITAEDVLAVLTRTKKDPLFELTNAASDRDWERSFFLLDALLAGEVHGLQALAALANQVRKLLVAKDFVASPSGAAWNPACSYPQFQKNVMPAVAEFDRRLLARLEEWESALAEAPAGGTGKKKKPKAATDLLLARNPANAFPVYQTLKKSDRFTRADLLQALEAAGEADLRLKSSALNPRLVLERVVRVLGGKAA